MKCAVALGNFNHRHPQRILAVAHDKIKEMGVREIRTFGKETHLLYDLKYIFSKNETDLRL